MSRCIAGRSGNGLRGRRCNRHDHVGTFTNEFAGNLGSNGRVALGTFVHHFEVVALFEAALGEFIFYALVDGVQCRVFHNLCDGYNAGFLCLNKCCQRQQGAQGCLGHMPISG